VGAALEAWVLASPRNYAEDPGLLGREDVLGHWSENAGKYLSVGQKFSLFFSARRPLKDLSLDLPDEMSEIQKMFSVSLMTSQVLLC